MSFSNNFTAPCVLQSKDLKTFVYCGRINEDKRTGHGVCLKSYQLSDVGLIAPSFNLNKFDIYESGNIPDEWKKHIDTYKAKYGTENNK